MNGRVVLLALLGLGLGVMALDRNSPRTGATNGKGGKKIAGPVNQARPAGSPSKGTPKGTGGGKDGSKNNPGSVNFPYDAEPVAAHVDPEALEWMARTMWGEARNEPDLGIIAIGFVILERVRDRRWPGTVKGVVLQRKQFSVFNLNDPGRARTLAVTSADAKFRKCLALAEKVLSGAVANPVPGANHYANLNTVNPSWDDAMIRVKTIGQHTFFKG